MPVANRIYRVAGDTPAIDAASVLDGTTLVANPGSRLEPTADNRLEPATKLTPYWQSDCGRAVVHVGDNVEVMARIESGQFHAVVTDPPYGLEFMGKTWDAPWKQDGSVDARQRRADEMSDPIKAKFLRHNTTYGMSDPQGFQAWFLDRAEAMLRAARPGAHLLSFGGTRMWHRMACAVEDAGWEIRDTVMWVYGSGFPKSHNVSKAIDKTFGVESKVVRSYESAIGGIAYNEGEGQWRGTINVTEGVTDAAKQWDGWGTALKPAWEPVVVARKPVVGSVARNVLDYECGGINVDGCRVGTEEVTSLGGLNNNNNLNDDNWRGIGKTIEPTTRTGRWPANLILSHTTDCRLVTPRPNEEVWECSQECPTQGLGSASRYFYAAKADADDRPHGKGAKVVHPTVKPLDLMCYLCRLVCAPGCTVLDPFMGSGSTGCAALEEGMRFVGIEQSQEYADIAVGRLRLALQSAPPPVELVTHGRAVVAGTSDAPPVPKRLRG